MPALALGIHAQRRRGVVALPAAPFFCLRSNRRAIAREVGRHPFARSQALVPLRPISGLLRACTKYSYGPKRAFVAVCHRRAPSPPSTARSGGAIATTDKRCAGSSGTTLGRRPRTHPHTARHARDLLGGVASLRFARAPAVFWPSSPGAHTRTLLRPKNRRLTAAAGVSGRARACPA